MSTKPWPNRSNGPTWDVRWQLKPELNLRRAVLVVTETCREFSEIDPRSESYRYPTDRKGQRSSKKHQVVNLSSFAGRMSSVLKDLDTIRFGLNIEMDMA